MVHFYGVERTEFSTQAAVHADIRVNIKLGRVWDRTPGGRVGGADDPDALRRTHLGANAARSAAQSLFPIRAFIVDQEWYKAELFRDWDLFFRILHGKNAASFLAGPVCNALIVVIPPAQPNQVVEVGFSKTFKTDAKTFQNTFNIHVPHGVLLTIHFTQDNVDRTEHTYQVRYFLSHAHRAKCGQVYERWSPYVIAPGVGFAVRDDVETKFPLGTFHPSIGFP